MTEAEFRELYNYAFPILYKVSYRITNLGEEAEDLCHNAFFRLHERNMVFPNHREATYWLIRVVKNDALNYAKREQRKRRAYQRFFKEDVRQMDTGEGELIKKETKEEVQDALNKLPKGLREVLILKEDIGWNYREIGKSMGISEGNVKVRVFRARKRLAVLLGGKSQSDFGK
ncbi:MAG: RNA polymerase sigma factor [Treponema sp.]|jgi:RNA polymerase sigma-70 factor (ECF subfamily)|nr:RNA polymerase sigma factor [Treponema sp.]